MHPKSINLESMSPALIEGADVCVQCGLCLSVCPTYQQTGEEIQSPRGRVMLYKAAAQGLTDELDVVLEAAYDCLDCRACQTICPSGVKPGELALDTRVALQEGKPANLAQKAMLEVFKYPILFDVGNLGVRLYQKSGLQKAIRGSGVLRGMARRHGGMWAKMHLFEGLIPSREVAPAIRLRTPYITQHQGEYRGTVAFFLGCVMNAVFSEASSASINVLARNGFDVILLRETTCCGAPHIEEGDFEGYRQVSLRNAKLYGTLAVDAIVTDCAACGAELKKMHKHFKDDPEFGGLTANISSKTQALSEFLKKVGLRDLPDDLDVDRQKVTYQDACHLCHAQGVCNQPRDILKQNPILDYQEMQNASDCCGSAGIYNITHTETSMKQLDRKMERIRATGASIITVENPGCMLQLDYGTREFEVAAEVKHTAILLKEAYEEADRRQTAKS
ncbi:(Fe-S)-binding protein [Deinococcus cellulosilyticus]|uniref:Glycolate oxidase iron-sulfur subunit n=1 Tax=Deinococcus cellulosilyticus (strain DSM 18568 / NBRC 106333 / KACC 11606 / 5516J-15) TaxID=1223518 RepID=A0A511NBN4_DEIC1|nr:(Fe-S)-binding protein [Deinococcus cellulosilyticus]GEM50007.1 glycolate oxidase iron-sulfur subunit [Deinococcus cellulosilyticus NBRC 106333 = KACC 11606]